MAFVGDGSQRCSALTADLGMAIGTGSGVAVEAGQVVLMSEVTRLAEVALGLTQQRHSGGDPPEPVLGVRLNTATIPLAAWEYLDPIGSPPPRWRCQCVRVVGNSLRFAAGTPAPQVNAAPTTGCRDA